jgi:predicted DNA-binding transcriptional regulator AlpA
MDTPNAKDREFLDLPAEEDQRRVTQPEAARLLGNVSQMTLWRWRNNPALNFPRSVEINGRHYYSRAEILAWRPPLKPHYSRHQGGNAA